MQVLVGASFDRAGQVDFKDMQMKQTNRKRTYRLGVVIAAAISLSSSPALAQPAAPDDPPPPEPTDTTPQPVEAPPQNEETAAPAPATPAPAPPAPATPATATPAPETPASEAPASNGPMRVVIHNLPDTLPYDEGDPIPPGYAVEERMRGGLLGAGIGISAGFHMPMVIGSAMAIAADREDARDYVGGFVPVVGPLILIGTNDTGDIMRALLVGNSVAQAAGMALILTAVFAQKTVLARDPSTVTIVGDVSLEIVPSVGERNAGIDLLGTF